MRAGTSLPPASWRGVSHSLETSFLPPSVGERELTHLKPTPFGLLPDSSRIFKQHFSGYALMFQTETDRRQVGLVASPCLDAQLHLTLLLPLAQL